MSFLLNILWLIFGGIEMALAWLITGVVCIIPIVTIPFCGACFKMAKNSLTPFGKRVVSRESIGLPTSTIRAVIWIIFFGIWLALGHLICGISLCLTIIGIPFGIQHFKLMKVAFNPYNYELKDNI